MTMPTRTIPVSTFSLTTLQTADRCFAWRQLEPGGYLLLSGRRAAVARQPQENLLELTCPPQDTAFWTHYLALDDDYDSIWQVLEHWRTSTDQTPTSPAPSAPGGAFASCTRSL